MEDRIIHARIAHAVFSEHCFPEPDDDAAWEVLARRAEEQARAEGVDLAAIGEAAERRVLEAPSR